MLLSLLLIQNMGSQHIAAPDGKFLGPLHLTYGSDKAHQNILNGEAITKTLIFFLSYSKQAI